MLIASTSTARFYPWSTSAPRFGKGYSVVGNDNGQVHFSETAIGNLCFTILFAAGFIGLAVGSTELADWLPLGWYWFCWILMNGFALLYTQQTTKANQTTNQKQRKDRDHE